MRAGVEAQLPVRLVGEAADVTPALHRVPLYRGVWQLDVAVPARSGRPVVFHRADHRARVGGVDQHHAQVVTGGVMAVVRPNLRAVRALGVVVPGPERAGDVPALPLLALGALHHRLQVAVALVVAGVEAVAQRRLAARGHHRQPRLHRLLALLVGRELAGLEVLLPDGFGAAGFHPARVHRGGAVLRADAHRHAVVLVVGLFRLGEELIDHARAVRELRQESLAVHLHRLLGARGRVFLERQVHLLHGGAHVELVGAVVGEARQHLARQIGELARLRLLAVESAVAVHHLALGALALDLGEADQVRHAGRRLRLLRLFGRVLHWRVAVDGDRLVAQVEHLVLRLHPREHRPRRGEQVRV